MIAPKKRSAPVMGLDVPYPKPKANVRLQAFVLDAQDSVPDVAASLVHLMDAWNGSTFEVPGLVGIQEDCVTTKRCAPVTFQPSRWPQAWTGVGVDVLASRTDAEAWMKQAVKAARTHLRRRHPGATVLFLVRYYRPRPISASTLATVQVSSPKRNGRFGLESISLTGQDMWARGVLFAKWYEQWCTAGVVGLMLEEVLERSVLKVALEATLAQVRSKTMDQSFLASSSPVHQPALRVRL